MTLFEIRDFPLLLNIFVLFYFVKADEDEQAEDRTPEVTGFNCRLCGSSSESHIDMINCMESHKVETSLGIRCDQCQLHFTNNNQLESHEMLCHLQEDFDEDSD